MNKALFRLRNLFIYERMVEILPDSSEFSITKKEKKINRIFQDIFPYIFLKKIKDKIFLFPVGCNIIIVCDIE